MKQTLWGILLLFTPLFGQTQTSTRINLVSITPSENTGQDYSSWLNDDLNSLVPSAWTGNSKWVDVTLKLEAKSLVSKLSFYDYEGVFTDKPAYIYALNGTQKIFLGLFEGLTYKTFVDLSLPQPLVADAIIVHKFGNNIPQKIKVFGEIITPSTVIPMLENRIQLQSISASENTGQDYTPWLNDDLNSMVASAWTGNSKWVDVTVKLAQKALINKLSLYDFEGVFSDYPAQIYAQNGSQKTLLATFDGSTYKNWVHYKPNQSVLADAIVVRKFGNNIPQKINVYGQAVLNDPLDVPAPPADERVKLISVTPSENTGQNYTPWLNDDLNSLVASAWTGNSKWVDVTLTFEKRSKINRLSFYDYEGVFTTNPASIYALDGTNKIFLGIFEGLTYKTFVDLKLPQPLEADAIIVHKFGNNIPQKVQVYGQAVSTTVVTPPTTPNPPTPPNPPVLGTKIPIDAKRWYQLNTTDYGLDGLFDGITDVSINTGWGKILSNYDAYYPLLDDEEITLQSIKFYDGAGIIKDTPMTLSIITDQWQRIPVATFTGETYNQWVGPNPTNISKFTLDTPPTAKIRYLLINSNGAFPTEIEIYGTYKASTKVVTQAPKREVKLKNGFGINAFEWDFLDNTGSAIDEAEIKPIKTFSGFRHYMDWDKLEHTEGSYTYDPTNSGGWNYDAVYTRCKAEGIEVLACLQTIPPWMEATYPLADQDRDNIPVKYGKDFANPTSYIEQAKVGFQYAARYGSNALVNPALLSVNDKPRWTADRTNNIKIGLNLVKYIECGNERDKWWRGRKAYQTAREYAANLSAFYDGHKNTMGAGVGVKNADPTMKVVMTGLASANTDYVRGMIDWCKEFRGYHPDGSVNICWDVVNYHYYSNNSNSSQNGIATRGTAPELSTTIKVADSFVQMAHRELNNMPVWVTELGYDANQGSPYKAIPIGNKTEYITQADWNLRSALLYNRLGIERSFFYLLYDDNFDNPTQFASSGFLNTDKSRKPTADFLFQATKLVGDYLYKETLSTNPVVDRYEFNGQSAYILYIPDEKGLTATHSLTINNFNQVKVYTPKAGSDVMDVVTMPVVAGKVSLPISETPIFVLPSNTTARIATAETDSDIDASLKSFVVFPNPVSDYVIFSLDNTHVGTLTISVYDANSSRVFKNEHFIKRDRTLKEKIDIRNLPLGIYVLEIKQGSETAFRKILKVE